MYSDFRFVEITAEHDWLHPSGLTYSDGMSRCCRLHVPRMRIQSALAIEKHRDIPSGYPDPYRQMIHAQPMLGKVHVHYHAFATFGMQSGFEAPLWFKDITKTVQMNKFRGLTEWVINYGAEKRRVDTRMYTRITHGDTGRQTQVATIPEGQNWPWLRKRHMLFYGWQYNHTNTNSCKTMHAFCGHSVIKNQYWYVLDELSSLIACPQHQ